MLVVKQPLVFMDFCLDQLSSQRKMKALYNADENTRQVVRSRVYGWARGKVVERVS